MNAEERGWQDELPEDTVMLKEMLIKLRQDCFL